MKSCAIVFLAAATLGGCAPSTKHVPSPDPVTAKEAAELEQIYADGLEYHKAGRFDAALEDWERVWRRHPDHANVEDLLLGEYLVRGLEAFTEGELDEAVRYWKKARRIRPTDRRVLAYLDRAREQQEHGMATE